MTIETALRFIAGFAIIISVLLVQYVSPWFMIFTAFVGLNLLQTGFTNWCPAMWVLQKMGLKHARS